MTHQFADRDINEIFTDNICMGGDEALIITYMGPTSSTYYTREDLLMLLDILDGKEDGVQIV